MGGSGTQKSGYQKWPESNCPSEISFFPTTESGSRRGDPPIPMVVGRSTTSQPVRDPLLLSKSAVDTCDSTPSPPPPAPARTPAEAHPWGILLCGLVVGSDGAQSMPWAYGLLAADLMASACPLQAALPVVPDRRAGGPFSRSTMPLGAPPLALA